MPTGYTAELYDLDRDAPTMEEYLFNIARAFGFLVNVRDYGLDYDWTKDFPVDPDPYYSNRLEGLEAESTRVLHMSSADADNESRRLFLQAHAAWVTRCSEREIRKVRYMDMRDQLESWQVPDELANVRGFALQQLADSSVDYESSYDDEPERLSGEDWRAQRLADLKREQEFAKEHLQNEIEQTAERNKFAELVIKHIKGVSV